VLSGKGVTGEIENITYSIGKTSWLQPDNEQVELSHQKALKANCVLVADNKVIAAFYLLDEIRSEAKTVVEQLNHDKKTLLLSGDSQTACDLLSKSLPIKSVYGGLTAQDKMQHIKQVAQQGYTIAMTGDGVNDSPVFGAAHVSLAMGCGADITKSGSDVILLNNKLSSITSLLQVAKKTRRIIFQNYLWAFGYNAIVLPLAVMGYITPYMAVIGMSASSILVITNSLRLLKRT
jgi:Cu2+-exporting ATPase